MSGASGIHKIDTWYLQEGQAACYLVVEKEQIAIIETGTSRSVDRILDTIQSLGLNPSSVRYIIVTHVHLDHAGGAGKLMHACSEATLVVHPRGGKHLIDPARLEASSRNVYGDSWFDLHYGKLLPVDPDRVRMPEDGEILDLEGRSLEILHTPGHATHHMVVVDESSHGVFTGDAFGLCYPPLQDTSDYFILPAATPVRFDPAAFVNSVRKILSRSPRRLYLTHYGEFEDAQVLGDLLEIETNHYASLLQRALDSGEEDSRKLREFFQKELAARVEARYAPFSDPLWTEHKRSLISMDLELNAQGLASTVLSLQKEKK